MAIRVQGARPGRRWQATGRIGPSVREVCLLGEARPVSGWAVGAEVEWEGRIYRVSATHEDPAGGDARRYVYLAPAPDDR